MPASIYAASPFSAALVGTLLENKMCKLCDDDAKYEHLGGNEMNEAKHTPGKSEAALEKAIVRWAMKRLKSWKTHNPQGLIPLGSPGALDTVAAYRLIEACLNLEKARNEPRDEIVTEPSPAEQERMGVHLGFDRL
jgi:hypothetical protein